MRKLAAISAICWTTLLVAEGVFLGLSLLSGQDSSVVWHISSNLLLSTLKDLLLGGVGLTASLALWFVAQPRRASRGLLWSLAKTFQIASICTLILAILCGLLWIRSYRWQDMRWVGLENGEVLCFESGYARQSAFIFTPVPPGRSEWATLRLHAQQHTEPWAWQYLHSAWTAFDFRPKHIVIPAWLSMLLLLTSSATFFGLGRLHMRSNRA